MLKQFFKDKETALAWIRAQMSDDPYWAETKAGILRCISSADRAFADHVQVELGMPGHWIFAIECENADTKGNGYVRVINSVHAAYVYVIDGLKAPADGEKELVTHG